MRRRIVFSALLLVLLAGAAPARTATVTVSVTKAGFVPSTLTTRRRRRTGGP